MLRFLNYKLIKDYKIRFLPYNKKNIIMKADSPVTTPKESRYLGPLIEKIVLAHQKNQQKQIKAQSANHQMIADFNKRKKKYETNKTVKQTGIIKKISQDRNRKVQLMKKKSQHIRKIMDKFHRIDEQRIKDKIDKINKRNFSSHKSSQEYQQINSINKLKRQFQFRSVSNSLDLAEFYNKNLLKTAETCKQIMEKSLQKQEQAALNRKLLVGQSKIKQLNQQKIFRKIKADQDFSMKQSVLIRKSILKLELSEKRSEQLLSSQRLKSLQRKQQQKKNNEKIKKKRQVLQLQLSQKFQKLENMIKEKNEKIIYNKQNLQQSVIKSKRNKRLKQEQNNLENYKDKSRNFYTKMSEMYKKDRQQWGFLTSVGQFKEVLIQKNIYDNSQLSLLK